MRNYDNQYDSNYVRPFLKTHRWEDANKGKRYQIPANSKMGSGWKIDRAIKKNESIDTNKGWKDHFTKKGISPREASFLNRSGANQVYKDRGARGTFEKIRNNSINGAKSIGRNVAGGVSILGNHIKDDFKGTVNDARGLMKSAGSGISKFAGKLRNRFK